MGQPDAKTEKAEARDADHAAAEIEAKEGDHQIEGVGDEVPPRSSMSRMMFEEVRNRERSGLSVGVVLPRCDVLDRRLCDQT